MTENKGLLSSGLGMVMRNKRYILWFWLLDLLLTIYGTSAFREASHTILDHSMYGEKLIHGFDVAVLIDLFAHPEFGPTVVVTTPAFYFAVVFFLATALFLPGVLAGYASTYRLPREDFFRACGRNLWRFIRLMIISGIVMGIATGALFGLHGILERKAAESTNELLLPEVRFIGLGIIFLIMTVFRFWFDLAEVDIVLNDQRAVRKSIAVGFRHAFRSMGRLLACYVCAAIVATIILCAGLLFWEHFVPSASVLGAFLISQITLFLLLIPRFWQRGVAVSYWQQRMMVPVVAVLPVEPLPIAVSAAVVPEPPPVIPDLPPAPQGS